MKKIMVMMVLGLGLLGPGLPAGAVITWDHETRVVGGYDEFNEPVDIINGSDITAGEHARFNELVTVTDSILTINYCGVFGAVNLIGDSECHIYGGGASAITAGPGCSITLHGDSEGGHIADYYYRGGDLYIDAFDLYVISGGSGRIGSIGGALRNEDRTGISISIYADENDREAALASIHWIPEPATLALLSLGLLRIRLKGR